MAQQLPDQPQPHPRPSPLRSSRLGGDGVVAAIQFMVDAAFLELCVVAGLWVRELTSTWLPINLSPITFHGIYLAILTIPVGCHFRGLYPGYGLSPVDRLRRRTMVALIGFGLMSVYDHLAQNGQWSRGVLLLAMVFSLVALQLSHLCARHLLVRMKLWGERVAVLGMPEHREALIDMLRLQPELGWIPVAEGDWPPAPQQDVDNVGLAILLPPHGEVTLSAVIDRLQFRRVVVIPDLGGRSLGVFAHETGIGLGLEMRNNLLYPANKLLKRVLDLCAVVLIAPLALPVIAVFVVMVKMASPGPAFYAQWREGKDGRPFRLWKIRSMAPDAETRLSDVVSLDAQTMAEWKTTMKLTTDPRVIPGIGHFMRRFSIDELPQLFNVLVGHMSLVGPRPLPAYHLAEIPATLASLRRQVRPGITGWAQISGRSSSSVLRQVENDAYYIRNWSFWIDAYVLARTVGVVVSAKGAF